jgi:hypothetical protein
MQSPMKRILATAALAATFLISGCAPDAPTGDAPADVSEEPILRVGYLVPITLGEFDALRGAELGAA